MARSEVVTRFFNVLVVAVAVGVLLVTIQQARAESRWNREVLCIGILSNTENPAREVPRVQQLCADVGITP